LRDFSRYKSCIVKTIKTNKTLPKQLYQIWFWGLLAFLTDFCIKLAINDILTLKNGDFSGRIFDNFCGFIILLSKKIEIVNFWWENMKNTGIRAVAGPVIQATGRSEFEDGLGSGDFVSGYSYHMSVRTRLSDHMK
jgi:hypothetical protein